MRAMVAVCSSSCARMSSISSSFSRSRSVAALELRLESELLPSLAVYGELCLCLCPCLFQFFFVPFLFFSRLFLLIFELSLSSELPLDCEFPFRLERSCSEILLYRCPWFFLPFCSTCDDGGGGSKTAEEGCCRRDDGISGPGLPNVLAAKGPLGKPEPSLLGFARFCCAEDSTLRTYSVDVV
jgi:hypothetical protein